MLNTRKVGQENETLVIKFASLSYVTQTG